MGGLRLDLLGSTFVGMGMSLPALVLFFLTWTQNSERRRWIISGPYPLDRLGSGPLQVWIGVLGVVVGCILLSLGLIVFLMAEAPLASGVDLHQKKKPLGKLSIFDVMLWIM